MTALELISLKATGVATELGSASKEARMSQSSVEYAYVLKDAKSASVIRIVRMSHKYLSTFVKFSYSSA